jgi:hypothetical protein
MAGQQEKPPVAAAPAQSEPALQYRILQLVSAGNTEQQINEAAASGYRAPLEPMTVPRAARKRFTQTT